LAYTSFVQKDGESWLKKIRDSALGLIILVVVLSVPVVLLVGMVWVSDKIYPWILTASKYAVGICIFVLLPLCIFRKLRPWAGLGFFYASFVFGVMLWAYSCLFAFDVWGFGGLIIGLIFAGVGVVPVALLAALLHAQWWRSLDLVVGIVLTFGTRVLGAWLSEMKTEEQEVLARPT
jgi:hypothetical protein